MLPEPPLPVPHSPVMRSDKALPQQGGMLDEQTAAAFKQLQ